MTTGYCSIKCIHKTFIKKFKTYDEVLDCHMFVDFHCDRRPLVLLHSKTNCYTNVVYLIVIWFYRMKKLCNKKIWKAKMHQVRTSFLLVPPHPIRLAITLPLIYAIKPTWEAWILKDRISETQSARKKCHFNNICLTLTNYYVNL